MAPTAYNARNPAVKRILQEIKEVQADTSGDFIAEALEEDIFEWHFIIRGAPDTEFEGGIYHGRILLPAEYPFKPPAFMMLTPSGRFETGVKICLTISAHHPEMWQPSWSVRTALTALVAFMPSPGQGALGSLDWSKEERQRLAAKSRTDIPKYGTPERQKLINEMHAKMLAVPSPQSTSRSTPAEPAGPAGTPSESAPQEAGPAVAASSPGGTRQQGAQQDSVPSQDAGRSTSCETAAGAAAATTAATQPSLPASAQVASPARAEGVVSHDAELRHRPRPSASAATTPAPQYAAPGITAASSSDTFGLTVLAGVLILMIVAVLIKMVARGRLQAYV